jgi:hypothetical protein
MRTLFWNAYPVPADNHEAQIHCEDFRMMEFASRTKEDMALTAADPIMAADTAC